MNSRTLNIGNSPFWIHIYLILVTIKQVHACLTDGDTWPVYLLTINSPSIPIHNVVFTKFQTKSIPKNFSVISAKKGEQHLNSQVFIFRSIYKCFKLFHQTLRPLITPYHPRHDKIVRYLIKHWISFIQWHLLLLYLYFLVGLKAVQASLGYRSF